jgi:hypothetical protein
MAVVLVVALLALQRMQYFLMTNKGIYLALQGNYHDAEAQLDYVVTARPENMRARHALAQVELDLGNYGVAQSIYHGLAKDTQKLLGEAICYYETDREDLAAEMLAQAREEAAAHKNEPARELVEWAPEILRGQKAPTEFLNLNVEALPRAQRMFALSLQSRVATVLGKLRTALRTASEAIELGDRNSRSRRLAIILAAAAKDFTRAQYFADTAGQHKIDWDAVKAEIRLADEHVSTRSIALPATDLLELRRLALRGARAWALRAQAGDTMETAPLIHARALAASLLRDAPLDVSYLLLAAQIAEEAGDPAEAYRLLCAWSKGRESYAVRLRSAELAGEPLEAALEEFADVPTLVAMIGTDDLVLTGGSLRRGVAAFYEAGMCGARVEVPDNGEYFIVLTARGDRAFGLSPLVACRVDGKKLCDIYIAQENWASYPVAVNLTAGTHWLELEYVNNSERLPSDDEDRNFYLSNIIVTRNEGSERGPDPNE